MIQYQVGMEIRVEPARFEALIDENAVLARELARAQQRTTRQAAEHADRILAMQAESVRLRGQLMTAQSVAAFLREDLQALRESVPDIESRPALANRAVLCVGGRMASVSVYRRLIEGQGGRFLHHDGREEHGAGQLDATLAAADLVICQAGCLSHNACWRVKDHCKRTGKRCVFVETPSASSLQRALVDIGSAE